jgi:hypothetical protein
VQHPIEVVHLSLDWIRDKNGFKFKRGECHMSRFMLFCIGLCLVQVADALTFSRDTLRAFDGQLWNGNLGDDSTLITNNSSSDISIDSIFFEVDTSLYDASYEVGWIEKSGAERLNYIKRVFNNDSLAHLSCHTGGTSLKDYNARAASKIQIPANGYIKVFSPYFSTQCSLVGIFIDCWGPCYPTGWQPVESFFSGRLIYVSRGFRDTLHLNCDRVEYVSGVAHGSVKHQPITMQHKESFIYNVLGQRLKPDNKLRLIRSFRVKRELTIGQ